MQTDNKTRATVKRVNLARECPRVVMYGRVGYLDAEPKRIQYVSGRSYLDSQGNCIVLRSIR